MTLSSTKKSSAYRHLQKCFAPCLSIIGYNYLSSVSFYVLSLSWLSRTTRTDLWYCLRRTSSMCSREYLFMDHLADHLMNQFCTTRSSDPNLQVASRTRMQWANPPGKRGEYYLPTIQTRYELPIILQELQLHVGLELGVQAGDFALFLLQNWPQCRRYYLVDPWTPIENYNVGTVTHRNLAYCRIGQTSTRASRAISWRLPDKNFFLILGKPSFCAWPATKHSVMCVMENSISSTSTPAMITVPRRMISLVGYWLINKSIDRMVAQGASRWSLRRPRL